MAPHQGLGREGLAALAVVVLVAAGSVYWLRNNDGGLAFEAAPTPKLEAVIAANAELRTGELRNGMHYFVRANASPKARAELRLVVNAGAVLEGDDQRGLAHAVEHMVFRGTKRFPHRAIDGYLQSIGMRAGEDINAWTSEDETVYRLTVPTSRPGALDTGLAILADMAREATFDRDEARMEAGVVFAEWRSGHDVRYRLRREREAVLLAGSRYADRPTIGDTSVLRRFDVGAMRRFYDDWYRPELMAVIAVGDFEAGDVERMLKKQFGSIPSSVTPRARPSISVPRVRTARAQIVTDAETPGSRVSLWFPRRVPAMRLVGDYRASLVEEVWRNILSARLADAANQPGAPLLTAGLESRSLVRTLDAELVSGVVVEGRIVPALDMLAGEVARLAQHGPTQFELTRHAEALLRDRRESNAYLDDSDDLVSSYIDQFLTGRTAIDREAADQLAQELVPTIQPSDILSASKRVALDSGILIVVSGPTHAALGKATPDELVAQARSATSRAAARQTSVSDDIVLIPHAPTPGQIASEQLLPDVQAIDMKLSNGLRVILKPTQFTNRQISFRLVGPGGASLANDADYPSAFFADGVIRSTGVGPVNGARLARILDSSSIALGTSVNDEEIVFAGDLGSSDLELLFQVLHLHFAAPRADTAAFERYRERTRSYAAHRGTDPDAVFEDSAAAATKQGHPRALQNTARFRRAVALSPALGFWRARMANASNFTLVMTGDFTMERMRLLLTRYMASLPAGVREQPRDHGVRFPSGIVRRTLRAGVGPRARTQITIEGPFDFTVQSSDALSAVRDVAERALDDRLRETLGGTYGVSVRTNSTHVPMRYSMAIEFEASPEHIDSLADAALGVLRRLHDQGPTTTELGRTRSARTRDLDDDLESNDYWASELSWYARIGLPLVSIKTHKLHAERLTVANLRSACAQYLETSHYTQVTMYPQASASVHR